MYDEDRVSFNVLSKEHMRFLIKILILVCFFFPTYVLAEIGNITEISGQVQVRTIKAKVLNALPNTPVSNGDMVKVRKKSSAHIQMKDESKFQIGEKTTLVFDDFLYDFENQKMRVRILDGALAYDGEKLVPNSDREFINNGFTLLIRGTKFAGKFSASSQIILLKGALDITGKGKKRSLNQPMQSLIFDPSGVGEPFLMNAEEVARFFNDNGLDFQRLTKSSTVSGKEKIASRTCTMILGKMVCTEDPG